MFSSGLCLNSQIKKAMEMVNSHSLQRLSTASTPKIAKNAVPSS